MSMLRAITKRDDKNMYVLVYNADKVDPMNYLTDFSSWSESGEYLDIMGNIMTTDRPFEELHVWHLFDSGKILDVISGEFEVVDCKDTYVKIGAYIQWPGCTPEETKKVFAKLVAHYQKSCKYNYELRQIKRLSDVDEFPFDELITVTLVNSKGIYAVWDSNHKYVCSLDCR